MSQKSRTNRTDQSDRSSQRKQPNNQSDRLNQPKQSNNQSKQLSPQQVSDQQYTKMSKFLSLVLRHQPSAANLTLDKEGWASTTDLIKCLASRYSKDASKLLLPQQSTEATTATTVTTTTTQNFISIEHLQYIVDTCPKKRYHLSADKTKIRASQGHSIAMTEVNLGFTPLLITDFIQSNGEQVNLYHGTSIGFFQSISKLGLLKMSRQFVHLSSDKTTAHAVALRHCQGKKDHVIIFKIDIAALLSDKKEVYKSENNVYLCEHIDPKYLILLQSNLPDGTDDGKLIINPKLENI